MAKKTASMDAAVMKLEAKVKQEEATNKKAFDDLFEELDKQYQYMESDEKALYHLLSRFRDELPALDGYFHKAFRQCDCVDVTAGGHMDIAIHSLLYNAPRFWRAFEKYRIDKPETAKRKVGKGKRPTRDIGSNQLLVYDKHDFNSFTDRLLDLIRSGFEVVVSFRSKSHKPRVISYENNADGEGGGMFVHRSKEFGEHAWYNDGSHVKSRQLDIRSLFIEEGNTSNKKKSVKDGRK